jgi:ubiquinone/menaquinone biosynthesis C-methylase UbiE
VQSRSENALSHTSVNFDRIARPYRWLEYVSFGPWLELCRSAQLAHLTGARHALLLGDGDGRFLARLLAVHPTLTADVVDSSHSMLRILDRRVCRSGRQARQRICLHHSDALAWNPTRSYDLIVSHFFLDCFFPGQLEQLFDRLLPCALPGARWVISEFAIHPSTPAAQLARGVVGLLYRAFGLLTGLRVRVLPDYATALRRRGLVPIHESRYLAGLLRSQVWSAPPPAGGDFGGKINDRKPRAMLRKGHGSTADRKSCQ